MSELKTDIAEANALDKGKIMDNQEAHDLLIKIDTRQEIMSKELEKIRVQLEGRKCQSHAEQLKTHGRIIWGTVVGLITLFLKAAWESLFK